MPAPIRRAALQRRRRLRPRRLSHPSPATRWLALAAVLVSILLATAVLAPPLAKGAILVLLVALFLAQLAAPLVESLRRRITVGELRRPLPRVTASGMVFLALAAAAGVAWLLGAPKYSAQVQALSAHAPAYVERAIARAHALDSWAERLDVPRAVQDALTWITMRLSLEIQTQARATVRDLMSAIPHVAWIALAPLLAFVLINGSPAFRRSAIKRLPEGHLRWRGDELFRHVNSVLAGYVRAQVAAALLVGVVSAVVFALLRVPYAFSVGLGSGALELVPILGPLATAVIVSTLVSGDHLLLVLAFLLALRIVQDYWVYPRLLGRGMHLHPFAVMLAIWTGAHLGGLVGILASVPAVGLLSVGWRHWREYRAIETLVREHAARVAVATAAAARSSAAPPDNPSGGQAAVDELPAASAPGDVEGSALPHQPPTPLQRA